MFMEVWTMVLSVWNDVLNIPFFRTVSLADVILWIFTFFIFMNLFVRPLSGGKKL